MKIRRIMNNIFSAIRAIGYQRNESVVLFDAWFGERFADNPRFLFQYLSDNKDKYGIEHVVWVSRNKDIVKELRENGYESYLLESKKSIEYHKKAKYLICNNAPVTQGKYTGEFLGRYSYGAKKINLWHGVGVVKGIWFESNEYKEERARSLIIYRIKEWLHSHATLYRKFMEREGGWGDCYYVATTTSERSKMMRYLRLPENRFIITGYARNCKCLKLLSREKKIKETIQKYKYKIIYMPTFKTGDNDFDFRSVGGSIKDFLSEKGILWIQKGHLADKFSADYDLIGNVLSLPNDFDTSTIVGDVSLVITDYSSAMMDGLIQNKPVLLYAPDYDIFVNGERGLLPDAVKIMLGCGHIYKDIDALKCGIIEALYSPELAKPKEYYSTKEKFWGEERDYDNIWKDIVDAVG